MSLYKDHPLLTASEARSLDRSSENPRGPLASGRESIWQRPCEGCDADYGSHGARFNTEDAALASERRPSSRMKLGMNLLHQKEIF